MPIGAKWVGSGNLHLAQRFVGKINEGAWLIGCGGARPFARRHRQFLGEQCEPRNLPVPITC
jgi:hypothetical protein